MTYAGHTTTAYGCQETGIAIAGLEFVVAVIKAQIKDSFPRRSQAKVQIRKLGSEVAGYGARPSCRFTVPTFALRAAAWQTVASRPPFRKFSSGPLRADGEAG
jgi:hypothetical protein